MTNAEYLRIVRLPGQIASAEARLHKAETGHMPYSRGDAYRARRRAAAAARLARLRARAAALGLRDLAQ